LAQLEPAHDPEKREPAFGQDHAQVKSKKTKSPPVATLAGFFC
jgi:hypothetical protein